MKSIRVFLAACILFACASVGRAEDGVNEEFSKLYRSLGVASYVVKAGDFASTEYGLRLPGVYERNPMMQGRGVRLAATVAIPVFFNWVTDQIHRDGHGEIALWMRIVWVVAHSVVVANNFAGGF